MCKCATGSGCALDLFVMPQFREQLKSLKLRSDDKDDKGRRKVAGSVLIAFTCDIPDRQRLLKAYERSPYPPAVSLAKTVSVQFLVRQWSHMRTQVLGSV